MDNFSNRLELLIKENKTKKKVLAESIGLTPAAITDMVKGRSKSTKPTIRAIANYFHVNEEWLAYGTGEIMEPISTTDVKFKTPARAMVEELLDNESEDFLKELVAQLLERERVAKGEK